MDAASSPMRRRAWSKHLKSSVQPFYERMEVDRPAHKEKSANLLETGSSCWRRTSRARSCSRVERHRNPLAFWSAARLQRGGCGAIVLPMLSAALDCTAFQSTRLSHAVKERPDWDGSTSRDSKQR